MGSDEGGREGGGEGGATKDGASTHMPRDASDGRVSSLVIQSGIKESERKQICFLFFLISSRTFGSLAETGKMDIYSDCFFNRVGICAKTASIFYAHAQWAETV